MKTNKLLTTLLLIALCSITDAQEFVMPEGKGIYIPKDLQDIDFTQRESKWSYHRMAATPNVVCFWEKGFGDDLSKAPDLDGHPMRVDLDNLLSRIEYFYQTYRDVMRFTLPGSKADSLRMMVMLNYSLEGTAYGGDYDNQIGALWIAPNRVQDKRLNCIAHELGHSFQIQVACDGQGHGIMGGIYEMCSQWMLWHVNPNWVTDENYHWQAFIPDANLRFLAGANIYRSPYMLEYWSMRRGVTVMGRLFRETRSDEDVCQAYMRLYGLSLEDFAREAVDCYSRLLTFDFPDKHDACRQYAGQLLNDKPLQQFGANVRKIDINGRRRLNIKFRGEGENDGFAYRLVAVNDRAEATYGDISTRQSGSVSLTLPDDAKHAYLVVTAYPTDEYETLDKAPRTYKYSFK